MELKLLARLFVLLALLCSQQGWTAEVKGLYEIEVWAKSRSDEDRNKAIQEALSTVLGRVVAADNVQETPVVKTAIAGASHYVRQFQYSMSADDRRDDGQARLMRVLFDEAQLLNLLRSGNIGIWSEIRPETLVWLVVDEQGDRRFYHADDMPELTSALSRAARLKGLPIIFPLLDLQEQQQISVNEVLSADSRQLLSVSERYDVVSVMAGRVVDKGRCWRAEWALYFDEKIKQWVSPCGPIKEVMLAGMQGAYDVLSKYYGVKPDITEIGYTVLKIKGVNSMTDMIRVTDFLESLPIIKAVNWVSVEGGYNVYKIKYEGNEHLLAEALTNANVLTPLPGAAFSEQALKYQLVTH
ncbi:DUF2066 domain-containing protein [Methylomarinum sp. Ch1-1]|uniref:DUF2066 domain-containing protein n=1 Tax=Methylomarinum roseum TaxID=3067653 RepID=A0AAU7NTC5_9GAMM|nr:DUF2066 domain-containing protein [Methylomarinum sp. Ch1-1]MDP4519714.1 DUF2066 domain-containing protein [Methylomarinum sp. Ch1-1]